jgi:hypothetical protein
MTGLRIFSKTSFQSHGHDHGAGIYLADLFEISMLYSSMESCDGAKVWKNSRFKDCVCVALCEVSGCFFFGLLGFVFYAIDI